MWVCVEYNLFNILENPLNLLSSHSVDKEQPFKKIKPFIIVQKKQMNLYSKKQRGNLVFFQRFATYKQSAK